MFWEIFFDLYYYFVVDVIRRDRFELIFLYLYFVDNSKLDESDRFVKVRFFIVRMNRSF